MNFGAHPVATLIASFGGAGRSPVAPGTVGSFAALVIGAFALQGPGWVLPVLAALATLAGLVAIPYAVADRAADPGWVVIDEVAGQWITMLGLGVGLGHGLGAATPMGLLAAFALFRVLDIAKPGPIGWADRKAGAVGIMLDDVLAGLIGAAVLLGARHIGLGGLL